METLIVKDINFAYNEKTIISHFSYSFNPNKIYAIIGESGSGKSTLAAIFAGHLKANSGELIISHQKANLPSKDVFIVHQENDLFPWQTTIQQLEFVKNLSHSETDLDSLLKTFKLDHVKNLYPSQLSGGMKKRLAIIRAIVVNPKVLILDETLSSLDPKTLYEILDELIPYLKEKPISVIIITHHLESIKKYIDEVIKI